MTETETKTRNDMKNNNGNGANAPDTDNESEFLRLPEATVIMSPDSVYQGREQEGKIIIKYGRNKGESITLPYMSAKKFIDFCRENKELFNTQLRKELEKQQLEEL